MKKKIIKTLSYNEIYYRCPKCGAEGKIKIKAGEFIKICDCPNYVQFYNSPTESEFLKSLEDAN